VDEPVEQPVEDTAPIWSHEGEITQFPVPVSSLNSLGIVDSSFTLMATVWRDPDANDDGSQYVSDHSIFGLDQYRNGGDYTNLHFLVRSGKYFVGFYRSGYPEIHGPKAAKGTWEQVAFVLDKDAGKVTLYVNGLEAESQRSPPLDNNPGNANQLNVGQYASGRNWKGKMKDVKILKYAWKP